MGPFEPYNQEAEEAFVGSFFLDGELVKECNVLPEQLYIPHLRLLYAGIRSLVENGMPVDLVTLLHEIGVEQIQNAGGMSYISQLAGSVPSIAHFHSYEKIVKEYDKKRKTIATGQKIIDQATSEDIAKTLSDGIHELMTIKEDQTDDDTGEITSSLVELFVECEQDQGDFVGIPSGFHDLDRLTGGFLASDLVIIGARPSMGKTAFALSLALQAAEEDVSLIFSLEMSKKQLVKRMTGSTGQIDSLKMRNPQKSFGDEDWEQFANGIGQLSHLQLHIFDRAGMDVAYIRSKVRKARREYGESRRMLVVIDYLQLLEGDRKTYSNRQAEISEISRALKTMARELNVTVIALSQLSRGVETRHDKHPILSDLRESGQIEQDADLIAFLYRDDYYNSDSSKKNKMEIILAKHRNGPTGTIELGFNKQYGAFVNL
ncbi:replicative DNA helicase [Neobacillus niacini]|uniref:replicative DNA helicase n=1 Tax=Neobacillus niacini TaxID=86668 RepID=UPI0021CB31B4|nr:replicative DNA helicase [Neobacillus niacini]MCM3768284.1 replicative DNA helicase [Neobacillus niacini]